MSNNDSGRILIEGYECLPYKGGPRSDIYLRYVLTAWGYIDGDTYSYSIVRLNRCLGIVPYWFIKEAAEGFQRAMLRKDRES